MFNSIKNAICFIFFKFGLLSFFDGLTSKKIKILTYHEVSHKNFREQLAYLIQKNYTIVDLDYVEALIRAETDFPFKRIVAITFDDGYSDKLVGCYSNLIKNGFPFTIFVSPGVIERNDYYWWDKLIIILLNSKNKEVSYKDKHYKLTSPKKIHECYKDILKIMKELTTSQIETDLLNLNHELGPIIFKKRNNLLNWSQMKIMLRKNVLFGGHTMNHAILTNEKKGFIKKDLVGSKDLMEKRLDSEIRHFSYPNGIFDDFCKKSVQESGYRTAVCTRPGFVLQGSDPFELNRIGISSDDNIHVFATKISGVFPTIVYNHIISG